jgi:hypothetical protein
MGTWSDKYAGDDTYIFIAEVTGKHKPTSEEGDGWEKLQTRCPKTLYKFLKKNRSEGLMIMQDCRLAALRKLSERVGCKYKVDLGIQKKAHTYAYLEGYLNKQADTVPAGPGRLLQQDELRMWGSHPEEARKIARQESAGEKIDWSEKLTNMYNRKHPDGAVSREEWDADLKARAKESLKAHVAQQKQASVNLDIEVGDVVLTGRYKNKRTVVKELGTDNLGQPTMNGQKLLAMRIEKNLPKNKQSKETQNMEKKANINDTLPMQAFLAGYLTKKASGDAEQIGELNEGRAPGKIYTKESDRPETVSVARAKDPEEVIDNLVQATDTLKSKNVNA